MHICKICGMELPSKKALVYHLSSKLHKKQSVYCPWCNVKNVITRVTDLKAHCLSKHFVELDLQPKNFIGGNNCFYFAVYPEDYVDIFKPEPWANPMAVEARRLMMNMTERVGMSLKERDKIRDGWKQGNEKLSSSEEKENKIRKRIASEKSEDVEEVYEKLFTATPINLVSCENVKFNSEKQMVQPKKKVKLNAEVSSESKKVNTSDKQASQSQTVKLDKTISTHNKRETSEKPDKQTNNQSEQNKEQRHYEQDKEQDSKNTSRRTEKDNVINKYRVKDIHSETNTNVKNTDTDLEDEEDSDMQTVIKLETGKDGIRRLVTTKQWAKEGERIYNGESSGKKRSNGGEMLWGDGKSEGMKKGDKNVVKNDDEIKCVKECEESKAIKDDEIVNLKESDKNVDAVDDIKENNVDEVVKDDEIDDMFEDDENKMRDDCVKNISNEQDTDIDCNTKGVDDEKVSQISEKGDAYHEFETEVNDSENEDFEVDMNEKDMASVWKKWNMERPKEKAEKVSKEERSIKFKIKDGQIRRILEIPRKTETEEAVDCLLEKELKEDKVETKVTNELAQTKQELIQTHQQRQTFSERAISLLNTGAMPLCPPGRRDWSSVIVPILIPVGSTSLSWPPLGWQNMSADRKLLEWEAASWKLECLTNGFVSAHLSRRYLLDKYMFLALPGSGGPKVETSEKACSASRAFTYKMLKELARGERQPTRAEEDHLSTLEYLVSSDLSRAIDLNSIQVPLKLTLEDN